MTESIDLARLEQQARTVAKDDGLAIEEQWWPGVLLHLQRLLEQAAAIEEQARQ